LCSKVQIIEFGWPPGCFFEPRALDLAAFPKRFINFNKLMIKALGGILAWLLHYTSALVMPKAIAEAPKILLVVETETPPKSRFLFA